MNGPEYPTGDPTPRTSPRPRGGRRSPLVGCLITLTVLLAGGLMMTCLVAFLLFSAVAGGSGIGEFQEETLFGEGEDKIALIPIQGTILGESGPNLFGVSLDMVKRVKDQMKRAQEDPKVRGIVLQIDSPGGSVTASDILHREVQKVREGEMKVVVLMGDLCASGGYYVAVAAEKIYAHPTTLTGSIGAIIAGLDLSELMEEFGVKENVVKSAPVKDILSSTRPMTDEERRILQGVVDEAHRRFVRLVAEGRSLTEEELSGSTDGRIFLAPEAKERGLIDEIGYLEDAVDGAKALAGISEARVIRYRKQPGLAEVLLGVQARKEAREIVPGLPVRLADHAPRLLYLWNPGG